MLNLPRCRDGNGSEPAVKGNSTHNKARSFQIGPCDPMVIDIQIVVIETIRQADCEKKNSVFKRSTCQGPWGHDVQA